MTGDRVALIESLLTEAFSPSLLVVKDQSHLHEGHAGARGGLGHFEVIIEADAFAGRRPLECHRMVFEALGTLMQTDIHALRLTASATCDK